MKALIFAAGVGSRLKPWTDYHPKALAPVGGVPMLERVIMKLKSLGVTEMVVNVHHFADQITDFLIKNDNFGISMHISDERAKLLDTGGGMLHAKKWLSDDDFIVHNADIYTDVDLTEMIRTHLCAPSADESPLATLLVSPRPTTRYLLFDSGMRMRGWENVKTGEILPKGLAEGIGSLDDGCPLTPLAFGGIHICSPHIFSLLETFSRHAGDIFSIIPFYVDACQKSAIKGFEPVGPYSWVDVGKPETLEQAQALFH